MPVYEASALTTLVTATGNVPIAAFRGPTANRARVREMHLFSITAPTTSGGLGLCRSNALGTGTLTSVIGVPHEPGDPATTGALITNWATAPPTLTAANIFRRWTSPASLGNGVIWTWDIIDPLVMPLGNAATGDLCIVNIPATAPGTYYVTVVWEE